MPDDAVQSEDWISDFRKILLELDDYLCAYLGTKPLVDDLCKTLIQLNLAKAELGAIYDHFSSLVGDAMGAEKEILLEGGAKIEKRMSSNRTGWQHKDLANAVAKRIVDLSIDMDTGEVINSTEEMLVQVLDYVQPSYWRIKELQDIGINADHYCNVGETKTSVIVRKGSNK